MSLADHVSIPSTLAGVVRPAKRTVDYEAARDRRLLAEGYQLTTCPTCGARATREVCTIIRSCGDPGLPDLRRVILRCRGAQPAEMRLQGCPPVVESETEVGATGTPAPAPAPANVAAPAARCCPRCGAALRDGAHPNRRFCDPCRAVLAGQAGPQRRRIVGGPPPAECPCGCQRPVRLGNVYATQGCGRAAHRAQARPGRCRPRPYTCTGCGRGAEHRGPGSPPRLCQECRRDAARERRRRARTGQVALRSGACLDCGVEVRIEGRGQMPLRCPACRGVRIACQERERARRRRVALAVGGAR